MLIPFTLSTFIALQINYGEIQTHELNIVSDTIWFYTYTLLIWIKKKYSFPNISIAENVCDIFSLTTLIAFKCTNIKTKILMKNTPLFITVNKTILLVLQSLWHSYICFFSEFEVHVCSEKSYRYDKQTNYNGPHKRRGMHMFLWL